MHDTVAAVNEQLVAEQVRAGRMPAEVLDHLGHLKFNVYNPACQYCAPPETAAITPPDHTIGGRQEAPDTETANPAGSV